MHDIREVSTFTFIPANRHHPIVEQETLNLEVSINTCLAVHFYLDVTHKNSLPLLIPHPSYLDVSSDLVEALNHLDWDVDLIQHGLGQFKQRLRIRPSVARHGHTEAVGVAQVHIDGADV